MRKTAEQSWDNAQTQLASFDTISQVSPLSSQPEKGLTRKQHPVSVLLLNVVQPRANSPPASGPTDAELEEQGTQVHQITPEGSAAAC